MTDPLRAKAWPFESLCFCLQEDPREEGEICWPGLALTPRPPQVPGVRGTRQAAPRPLPSGACALISAGMEARPGLRGCRQVLLIPSPSFIPAQGGLHTPLQTRIQRPRKVG